MVAHVLRLRSALLLGSLNVRPGVLARRIGAFAVLAVGVAAVCVALVRLDAATTDVAAVVTVLVGSALIAGFALLPLFIGAEDPLDPRRFLVMGAEPGPLAATILIASLVGIPSFAVIAVSAAMASAWIAHGAPVFSAVLGALLLVVTCLVSARCASAVAALALRDRRSPQLTGLMLTAAGILVVPAAVFLMSLDWRGGLPSQLGEAADVLAVTPLGAASALASSNGPAYGVSLAVALLTVAMLVGAWSMLVRRMLTTTERPVPVRERRGLGWFAVMPGLPSGAIAARSTVYWFTDPRYLANVVIVPIASVLIVVPLLVVGVPLQTVALLPAPVMALFLGWLAHNDLAYDSTGIWLHFAAGVRGLSDRLGRLVPVVMIGVPLLALAITLSVWIHDRWSILPAMIGVCAGLFASGLGLSSIASVAAPYAASRPGEGPFEQPQRTGGAMAQALVLLGSLLATAPALWWAWQTLTGDASYAWSAFWGGIVAGSAVLVIGVVVGAAVYERRTSRIMEFAETL